MATTNNTRRKLPPGVTRRAADGKYLVSIRLKGFAPALKVFENVDDAIAWAAATRKEMTAQRARGGDHRVATLTVGDLVRDYLDDPNVKALKAYEDAHERLDWWVPNYGATRVIDFSVRTIIEARGKLMDRVRPGRERRKVAAGTVVFSKLLGGDHNACSI